MKTIISIILTLSIIFLCTSCASNVSMPYSSKEYISNGWNIDELVAHFEELGFSDIRVDRSETRYSLFTGISSVTIEDDSDSILAEYREFEQGENFLTSRKIRITYNHFIPTWTIDNCPEFAALTQMDSQSPERGQELESFLQARKGEYLEFDGIIDDWYDEMWFAGGLSFTIVVKDSNNLSFYWRDVDLTDLGLTGDYDYHNYKVGSIKEGTSVHMVSRIEYSEEGPTLEIVSFELTD